MTASLDRKVTTIELPSLRKWQYQFYSKVRKGEHETYAAICARQIGKTFAGAQIVVSFAALWSTRGAIIGVVAPTYAQAKRCYDYIHELLAMNPKFYKKHVSKWTTPYPQIKVKNVLIMFRSADKPDSIRGETFDLLWLEEAGLITPGAYKDVLHPTTTAKDAPVVVTMTPPAIPLRMNWVYQRIYKPAMAGSKHIYVMHVRGRDYYSKEKYERILRSMVGESVTPEMRELDPSVRREINAEFLDVAGLVFHEFDIDKHVITEEALPPTKKMAWVSAGADFGVEDPNVLLIGGWYKDTLYIIDEYYQKGKPLAQDVDIWKELVSAYDVGTIYGDPSAGEHLLTLAHKGLPIAPAIKGPNSIKWGIDAIKYLLRNRKIKIHARCTALIEEFGSYVWKSSLDADPDRDRTLDLKSTSRMREAPIDANNHALDSLRYLIVAHSAEIFIRAKSADEEDFTDTKDTKWIDFRSLIRQSVEDASPGRHEYEHVPH